jgi:hypothetical protein
MAVSRNIPEVLDADISSPHGPRHWILLAIMEKENEERKFTKRVLVTGQGRGNARDSISVRGKHRSLWGKIAIREEFSTSAGRA